MPYPLRRVLHAILLLFLISLLSFLFLQAAPGDFFDEMLLDPRISRDTVLQLKANFGLDQPVLVRYTLWLFALMRGELGYSFAYNMPVGALIWPRLLNTLFLASIATLVSWSAALSIGIGAAYLEKRWIRHVVSWSMSILMSVPELLLALALLVLALRTHVQPAEGNGISIGQITPPVLALSLAGLPILVRHTYNTVQEILSSPFIQAARAHGIPERRLLLVYALPVAANPLISLLGLSIGGLLSSSLVVEVVMNWPGIGPLFLDAIFGRDLYVVVAASMLSALFLIAGNLLADLLLYVVDPRVREA